MIKNLITNGKNLMIYLLIITLAGYCFRYINSMFDDMVREYQFYMIGIFRALIYIFLGVVLSYEQIIKVFSRNGRLRFNIIRFIIIVLPIGLIGFTEAFYYSNVFTNYFHGIPLVMQFSNTLLVAIQVLTGFLFISCFSTEIDIEISE